ncbi:MAG: hypothetical protein KF690_03305 [Bacteroidetes bacterium]|nr:hypothetical protein [Bacteroidota bacterium]
MGFRIHTEGAWERYGLLVWFDRFERIGRTAMAAACFLTFFLSLMVAAPFIYYTMQQGYEILNNPLTWVVFILGYTIAILLLQNLLWILVRGALWVLEEV